MKNSFQSRKVKKMLVRDFYKTKKWKKPGCKSMRAIYEDGSVCPIGSISTEEFDEYIVKNILHIKGKNGKCEQFILTVKKR